MIKYEYYVCHYAKQIISGLKYLATMNIMHRDIKPHNILLKDMWGRARPNDIIEFGGKDVFTPWYKFGDSCVSNCSFVSGDASVGFALIVFYFITKKNIFIYLSILFGTSLGFIRIIAGGHFFSDVVFSQIIVTGIMFSSFFIYKRVFNA